MKNIKRLICIFCCTICSIFLLTGCINNDQPQKLYNIGEEYQLGDLTVKIVDERDNERYVIYYTNTPERTEDNYFDFSFDTHSGISLRQSNEFEYSDNLGNIISFNQTLNNYKFYIFKGSRTFYVSYKNANEDIKQSIKDEKCRIDFGVGSFVYPESTDATIK